MTVVFEGHMIGSDLIRVGDVLRNSEWEVGQTFTVGHVTPDIMIGNDEHYLSQMVNIADDWILVERPATASSTFLDTANEIIHGDREQAYDHPHEEFEIIAQFCSQFLGLAITRKQVAAMMILLKTARLSHNIHHEDSWIDIAGYVGCADRVQRRIDGTE